VPQPDPISPARLDDVRALFPYVQDRVYLDTAAAGLTWKGHGEAVARFFDEVKCRGFDARPEWLAMTERVRARLAAWLGVAPADITFVSNTTEGLNLAALSLRFEPGDRVVLAADEFPSVDRVWDAAERAGACIVRVDIPSEDARQAALMQAVDGRTRVLAVSHTHWSTGTTVDLDALGRHCRQHGTLLMVDGMQALGAVPTRLDGVDIYAASFFKWMLSGFGIGVLVTSQQARERMTPAYRGYANADDAQRLQYAHVNMPAIYGLDATLDTLEAIGWDWIHARVAQLGGHLVDAADRLGLPLITPRSQHAGVWAVRAGDAEAARARLSERGISVSARGAGVRISPHFYNTEEDVRRGVQALAEVLGHRG